MSERPWPGSCCFRGRRGVALRPRDTYSTHPDEVSRLAAAAEMHVLVRTSRVATSREWTEGKSLSLILA